MMSDESIRRQLHAAAGECLSGVNAMPSQRSAVLDRINTKERASRRRISYAAVLAAVLMLALAGVGVAAGLGLFGWLRESKVDEMSYTRLGLLEESAVAVGETRRIAAGGEQKSEKPATVREALLAAQMEREYDLTIDQVYCDGRKLYYSYTFKMNDERLSLHEGEATGFDSWDEACPGERFEDVFDTWLGDAQNQRAADWLNSHMPGYVVKTNAFVGDGARLPDGTYLNPVDSGSEQADAQTMTAYYEVALPEGYEAGETIEFVLTVMASDTVYVQNETGAYMGSVFNRDARIEVPVSVQITGRALEFTGENTADGCAAKATLYASDVDLSGSVRIEAPESYEPEGYVLLADGVEYRNIDEWWQYDGQAHVLNLRFDLPETMNSLVLMPVDPDYAHEAITLK